MDRATTQSAKCEHARQYPLRTHVVHYGRCEHGTEDDAQRVHRAPKIAQGGVTPVPCKIAGSHSSMK